MYFIVVTIVIIAIIVTIAITVIIAIIVIIVTMVIIVRFCGFQLRKSRSGFGGGAPKPGEPRTPNPTLASQSKTSRTLLEGAGDLVSWL